MRLQIAFIIAITTFDLLTSRLLAADCKSPVAVAGMMDLRSWSFEDCPMVELEGAWRLYWQRFVFPKNLDDPDINSGWQSVSVPDKWTRKQFKNRFSDGTGWATYWLRILLPSQRPRQLAFYFRDLRFAKKVFINGELYTESGVVSTTPDAEEAARQPILLTIDAKSEKIDLVIQLSNFQHRRGGIVTTPMLGDTEPIQNYIRKLTFTESLGLGSVLFIAFYYFVVWWYQKRSHLYFYFAMFGLFTVLRGVLASSERLLFSIVDLGFSLSYRLEFFSLFGMHYCIIMFLFRYLADDKSQSVLRLYRLAGWVFVSLALFVSPYVLSSFATIYMAIWISSISIVLYFIFKNRHNSSKASLTLLTSLLIPFAAGVHDIFFVKETFDIPIFTHSIAISMLIQASMLAKRFNVMFNKLRVAEMKNNRLRHEISHQNDVYRRDDYLRRLYLSLTMENVELVLRQIMRVQNQQLVQEKSVDFTTIFLQQRALTLHLKTMRHVSLRGLLSSQVELMTLDLSTVKSDCDALLRTASKGDIKVVYTERTDARLEHFKIAYDVWLSIFKIILFSLKKEIEGKRTIELSFDLTSFQLCLDIRVKPLYLAKRLREQIFTDYSVKDELEFFKSSENSPLVMALYLARTASKSHKAEFAVRSIGDDETSFSVLFPVELMVMADLTESRIAS